MQGSVVIMTVHPSRVVASVLLIGGGSIVAVSALAIAMAKILVDAGMGVSPADAELLGDLTAVLPLVVFFAGVDLLAATGLLLGKEWADVMAYGAATAAVAVGAIGLVLIAVGHDPFAPTATAHSTADGLGILGAFTLLYLAVIVAIATARPPRRASNGAIAA
jgi:hypothetical protein